MATYRVNIKIKIGEFKPFNTVSAVHIKKSINNYLDTAVIELPAIAVLREKETAQAKRIDVAKQFKRGDKVQIELGYDEQYYMEFEGFVANVEMSVPVKIECEGYAFQLRGKTINKVYRGVKLKNVLKDIIAGTDIILNKDNDDIDLDKLEYIKFSRFEALAKLGSDLANAINIWFDGNVLNVGLKYLFLSEKNKNNKPDVVYKTGWNYPREGTLKQRNAGDENKEVEIVLKNEKGKKKVVKVGVTNSNTERKKLPILSYDNEKDAKRIANAKVLSENYGGVDGDINSFLRPYVKPGMKIKLIDPRYEELDGNYLCEDVDTSLSRSGGKRRVKLSYKL